MILGKVCVSESPGVPRMKGTTTRPSSARDYQQDLFTNEGVKVGRDFSFLGSNECNRLPCLWSAITPTPSKGTFHVSKTTERFWSATLALALPQQHRSSPSTPSPLKKRCFLSSMHLAPRAGHIWALALKLCLSQAKETLGKLKVCIQDVFPVHCWCYLSHNKCPLTPMVGCHKCSYL